MRLSPAAPLAIAARVAPAACRQRAWVADRDAVAVRLERGLRARAAAADGATCTLLVGRERRRVAHLPVEQRVGRQRKLGQTDGGEPDRHTEWIDSRQAQR